MPERKKEDLFVEFPPISVEQWEAQIIKDLKGADYEKKLVWNSPEGIRVKPYYTSADLSPLHSVNTSAGNAPYVRGFRDDGREWRICEEIFVSKPADANEKARTAISRGADSINFVIQDKIHTKLSEVISSKDDLAKLINGIDITKNKINFICGCNTSALVSIFEEYLADKRLKAEDIRVSFDFDVIGHLTLNGNFFYPQENVFSQTASLLNYASKALPGKQVLGINGYFFANAGATVVQELAYSLAIADDYLSKLTDAGLKGDEIISRMRFNFGISSGYFMEIAKLRAFRWLWSKVAEQYQSRKDETPFVCIHSITSEWNKTAYDPYVNVLRCTTEAMSAILGGASSVTVRPFDNCFRSPGDFSRRIARNIQIILKEEAHLNKVNDIAGGSYYIESLTESIAAEAWKLFTSVVEKGGYTECFIKGEIQKSIEESANKCDMAVASRQQVFIGTNQYPNPDEKISAEISPCMLSPMPPSGETEVARPIRLYRGALAFELLRLEVEKMPKRPKVFLLTYGNPAMRKARASFSSGFFGCAGYEIIDNIGFETVKEGADAAVRSKAEITVICSSDDEYPAIVPEIIKTLKDKTILVLAGFPKDHIDSFKAMGLQHFIHVKSNLLETLKQFNGLMKK